MAETDIRALVESKNDDLMALFETPALAQRFRESIFQLWADPESETLRQCAPATIVSAFMSIAELGLTLNKQRGLAYLVPFKGVATPMISYKGLIQLATECGSALDFRVGIRCERDEWSYNPLHPTQPIHHVPAENRGRKLGYYCAVFLPNGLVRGEYMTEAECKEHERKYSKQGWQKMGFDNGALKTVVRKVCKYLRLKGAFAKAVEITDYNDVTPDEELPPDDNPSPAITPEVMDNGAGVARQTLKLKPDAPSVTIDPKSAATILDALRGKGVRTSAIGDWLMDNEFGVNDIEDLLVSQIPAVMKAIEEIG